jgi:hypothetical protein
VAPGYGVNLRVTPGLAKLGHGAAGHSGPWSQADAGKAVGKGEGNEAGQHWFRPKSIGRK